VIELTLRQRKLSRLLGEDWWADYQRRKADGWSDREIAGYYQALRFVVHQRTISKWAERRRAEATEEMAA